MLLSIHSAYGVQVRLVGGTSSLEGRVEVYYNSRWGTICDDDFGTNDAKVICYMLGFERLMYLFLRSKFFDILPELYLYNDKFVINPKNHPWYIFMTYLRSTKAT